MARPAIGWLIVLGAPLGLQADALAAIVATLAIAVSAVVGIA